MLTVVRDAVRSLSLRARYRRLVSEQLVAMAESSPLPGSSPADADDGDWHPLGRAPKEATRLDAAGLRDASRKLARSQPYATNLLRLLEVYVAGAEPRPAHRSRVGHAATPEQTAACDRVWRDFLDAAAGHWSIREHARRVWRDGECFVRLFPADVPAGEEAVSTVRFVDPERIAAVPGHDSIDGIVPTGRDIETPQAYLKVAADGRLAERVDAAEMLHSRIGVDSNELRGRSVLEPMIESLRRYDDWLEIELQARKLQASIVLWRKVQTPLGATGPSSQLPGSASGPSFETTQREAIGAGTILTTGPTTDLQFLQPATNFGDAIPLGRAMLLAAAAAAGLPEFMLTGDAANANFASTMVAEGPAVKLFQSHQQWLRGELDRLWRWIMADAVRGGRLDREAAAAVRPQWTFPDLVSRDRPAERQADVSLIDAGVLSRAEVARRDNVDPDTMREEIEDEAFISRPSVTEDAAASAKLASTARTPETTLHAERDDRRRGRSPVW